MNKFKVEFKEIDTGVLKGVKKRFLVTAKDDKQRVAILGDLTQTAVGTVRLTNYLNNPAVESIITLPLDIDEAKKKIIDYVNKFEASDIYQLRGEALTNESRWPINAEYLYKKDEPLELSFSTLSDGETLVNADKGSDTAILGVIEKDGKFIPQKANLDVDFGSVENAMKSIKWQFISFIDDCFANSGFKLYKTCQKRANLIFTASYFVVRKPR